MKGGRCNNDFLPAWHMAGCYRIGAPGRTGETAGNLLSGGCAPPPPRKCCWAASTQGTGLLPGCRGAGQPVAQGEPARGWKSVLTGGSRKELADPEGLVCQDRCGLCVPFKVPSATTFRGPKPNQHRAQKRVPELGVQQVPLEARGVAGTAAPRPPGRGWPRQHPAGPGLWELLG